MTVPDYSALARDAVAVADSRPDDVAVLLHAAMMLLHAGETERARDFARNAVAVDPAHFGALRTLSGILDVTGQRAEAIAVANAAIELEPANPEVRLHAGAMLAAEWRWREAAGHLAVHVVSPAATPAGWRLLSAVLHRAGDPGRAIDAARQAVAADPEHIEYRLHLASLLSTRALYRDALNELYAALARAPANGSVWRVLSGVHAALGQLAEALQSAERAVELAAADDTECRTHLAHIAGLCALPLAAPDTAAWSIAPRRPERRVTVRRPVGLTGEIATRWRVIHAIMLRDMRTRFGHTRLGYLWAIMEPITHLMTLGVIFYALNRAPAPVGDNLFLFYITGLVPFLMFSHVAQDVMSASEANNTMLQLPIVKRTDIMAAHALRQFGTELCVGIVIFSIAALLGQRGLPADPMTALIAIVLLWLLAVGVGAFNLTIAEAFPSYETVFASALRLLYVASGIYYSPISMPDWAREILVWNPILQGIELFRSGFYPQYDPHWLDANYLLIWVVASAGTGFAMERALRGRMAVYT